MKIGIDVRERGRASILGNQDGYIPHGTLPFARPFADGQPTWPASRDLEDRVRPSIGGSEGDSALIRNSAPVGAGS